MKKNLRKNSQQNLPKKTTATKQDIEFLKKDIEQVRNSLKKDIEQVRNSLKKDIEQVRNSLKKDIKQVKKDLEEKIETVELGLDRCFDRRFDRFQYEFNQFKQDMINRFDQILGIMQEERNQRALYCFAFKFPNLNCNYD